MRYLATLLFLIAAPTSVFADEWPVGWQLLSGSGATWEQSFAILSRNGFVPSRLAFFDELGTIHSVWKVKENGHWYWVDIYISSDGSVGSHCANHPIYE